MPGFAVTVSELLGETNKEGLPPPLSRLGSNDLQWTISKTDILLFFS